MLNMLTVFLLGLTAIFAGQASASRNSSSAPTAQDGKSTQVSENSTRGCLSGSEDTFTLTEDRTGKVYALAGNKSDFEPNVGHEVEIWGQPTVGSNAAVESSAVSTSPSSTSDKNAGNTTPPNTYRVISLRALSDHCGVGAADIK